MSLLLNAQKFFIREESWLPRSVFVDFIYTVFVIFSCFSLVVIYRTLPINKYYATSLVVKECYGQLLTQMNKKLNIPLKL